jgi:hypothetical protein
MKLLSENKKIKMISASGLLVAGYLLIPTEVYALASVEFAIKEICLHMQGNLGGLLMATAGVGGLISAAFGNMKAMYSCVVTAIGAFTISSMLSLHFDEAAGHCNGGGGGNGGGVARTKITKSKEGDSETAEVSRFNVENAVKAYIDKSNGALGTQDQYEKGAEKYIDSYQEDSDMELF